MFCFVLLRSRSLQAPAVASGTVGILTFKWNSITELGNKNVEEDFDVVNEDFLLSACQLILKSEFESRADRAHSAIGPVNINSLAGRKEAKEEKGHMESSRVKLNI